MAPGRLTVNSAPVSSPRLLPRPRRIDVDGTGRRVPADTPRETVDPRLPVQGYRLQADDDGVRLTGADEAGLRHGRATLAQLRRSPDDLGGTGRTTVPACVVEDWPDFAVRGVMLDVSRDRVPSLPTLFSLVDRLASWKINQLQLYMEHTFAYAGHDDVWRHADPYTADDIETLDAHCRSRGIELVANQNTLGHFERWLRHERYRPLAIEPDGFTWLFGIHRPPCTLDPAKANAFTLVSDLLAQLVPHVASGTVHVGMDEPWELPATRRGEWAQWLQRLRTLPALDGRRLLVWGDVLAIHPDLLTELPAGVAVCEWGYEDNHPFADRAARLADAAVPFWVCPGTSSWTSLAGRVDNMIDNISSAARVGLAHGAEGLLVTDWGDMGHLQQPPVSDPGFATAAAFGWCVDAHADLGSAQLAELLDIYCYEDDAGVTGGAVVALGKACRMVTPRPPNMSALAVHVLLPQWKVGSGLTEGLTEPDLDAVESMADEVEASLGGHRMRRPDGDLVHDELVATAGLVRLSCRDARLRLAGDGTLASVPEAGRRSLSEALQGHIDAHQRLWRARFRDGGLDDSTAWLDHLAACYRGGTADPAWFGPYG